MHMHMHMQDQTALLPTRLYVCETWTVYKRDARKLNHFHTMSLKRFYSTAIKWQAKTPDTEVRTTAGLHRIHYGLSIPSWQSQIISHNGHVTQLACQLDHWLPKTLFYGELLQGIGVHMGGKKQTNKQNRKRPYGELCVELQGIGAHMRGKHPTKTFSRNMWWATRRYRRSHGGTKRNASKTFWRVLWWATGRYRCSHEGETPNKDLLKSFVVSYNKV